MPLPTSVGGGDERTTAMEALAMTPTEAEQANVWLDQLEDEPFHDGALWGLYWLLQQYRDNLVYCWSPHALRVYARTAESKAFEAAVNARPKVLTEVLFEGYAYSTKILRWSLTAFPWHQHLSDPDIWEHTVQDVALVKGLAANPARSPYVAVGQLQNHQWFFVRFWEKYREESFLGETQEDVLKEVSPSDLLRMGFK